MLTGYFDLLTILAQPEQPTKTITPTTREIIFETDINRNSNFWCFTEAFFEWACCPTKRQGQSLLP